MVSEDGSGNGYALLLTTREAHPPLPHLGAVPLGEGPDEIMCIGNLGSLLYLS